MPMFFVSLKEAYFVCHWCLLFIEEFRILELYVWMIFRLVFGQVFSHVQTRDVNN